MKTINVLGDSLKAVGYNRKGHRKEFNCSDGILHCNNQDLVSIEIPKGVTIFRCYNNLLTELDIPEGVIAISCGHNKINELNLPNSIKILWCDKHVLGLDNIDWDCDIRLF